MPPNKNRRRITEYVPYQLIKDVTFRDTDVLRRFISSQNKILPRRKTGLSAKVQRHITREIKQPGKWG